MRMESPLKTDWADAVTVRVGRDHDIAIQFPGRCPDDLLLAATVGIDLSHLFRDSDRPETLDDMGFQSIGSDGWEYEIDRPARRANI
jgi:hypothetical protein